MTNFETPAATSAKASAAQLLRQIQRAGQRNPAAFQQQLLQLIAEERQRQDQGR